MLDGSAAIGATIMTQSFETSFAHKNSAGLAALVFAASSALGCSDGSTKEPEPTPGVRYVGRVDASDPAAGKFSWSATGLVATVSGSKISASLETSGTSTVFFQPVIDGVAGERFQVASGTHTVTLGEGLADGAHTVELYRESEGSYGISVFRGFVEGTLGAPPASTGRLIEVIGDSISCGYGNLGADVHPPWDVSCPFSLETEAAYLAYGPMLGRALGAEVSVVARSGWGMYRDYGGSTANVMSAVYENTLGSSAAPKYDFARTPQAVIINLGTNDSSMEQDPGTAYEDAYVAFLGTVRAKNPSSWIFLTIGPMTSGALLGTMRAHLDNVVARFADARVSTVLLATQDVATTGCDYHPDVEEQQRIADTLQVALQEKLGW
jgi:lysophospholipase L1-like esterase